MSSQLHKQFQLCSLLTFLSSEKWLLVSSPHTIPLPFRNFWIKCTSPLAIPPQLSSPTSRAVAPPPWWCRALAGSWSRPPRTAGTRSSAGTRSPHPSASHSVQSETIPAVYTDEQGILALADIIQVSMERFKWRLMLRQMRESTLHQTLHVP